MKIQRKFKSINSISKSRVFAVAAIAIVFLALNTVRIRAQDDTVKMPEFSVTGASPDSYQSTESASASRIRGLILDTPESIHVATRSMMDDLGANRLIDSVRYLPGIDEGRGVGFSDRLTIRGFESNGRVVDNFSFNTAANFDSAIIDRIELLEGPSTILSPNGSPGGTMNLITKTPRYDRETTITGIVGLFGAQELIVDSTGAIAEGSRFAYRVVGHFQDTDMYWKPNGTISQKTINPMLTYKVSNRATLTFKYLYLDYFTWGDPRVIVDSSVTGNANGFAAPGFQRNNGNGAEPWNYRAAIVSKADLTLNTALSDSINMRLAADFWCDSEPSELASLAFPSTANRYNPYTGILTPDQTWAVGPTPGLYVPTVSPYYNPTSIPHQSSLGRVWNQAFTVQNDFAAAYKLSHEMSSTTVAGWALNHNLSHSLTRIGTLPAYNLYLPADGAYPVYPANLTSNGTSQGTSKQLYFTEKAGFYSDRVLVSGGASRLWVDNDSANVLAKTAASTLKGYHDTYLAGAVLKPTLNTSLYYSYASSANPTIANNVTLWQGGKQQEFGFKADFFGGRLSVSVAHFQITQVNVSTPNPLYQLDHTLPQSLISNFKNHGQEFAITGGITKDLSVIASVTGLREKDALGRRPRAVSDLTAGALLKYTFHKGVLTGLSANFGVQYTGDQEGDTPAANFTVLGVTEQPSFLVPAYTTTTAGASYHWRRYSFRVIVDNVFNSKYLYASGARFAVAQSSPTNFRLSAAYKF